MGNIDAKFIFDLDRPTIDYDPNDYKDVPKNELNLQPFAYPQGGLYLDYQKYIDDFEKIVYMPLEEQMKYSDAICRRYALNKHFLVQYIEDGNDIQKVVDAFIVQKSSCGIGNMAFVAYHNGMDSIYGQLYTKVMIALKNKIEP